MPVQHEVIDPNDVFKSIKERYLQDFVNWSSGYKAVPSWDDFLKANNIEVLSTKTEPCLMQIHNNKFVVCDNPCGLFNSLKIPQELATNIVGNSYFDNEATDADYPKIDNELQNLDKDSKKVIEEVKEFGDGSGNRNFEILIPVEINCDWNGDPWNPTVTVEELNDGRTFEYGVDWNKAKELENNAHESVLKKISKYKDVVQKIAISLKISSYDVHKYIMGWY